MTISEAEIIRNEKLAAFRRKDQPEYLEEKKLRERISTEAERYFNLPVSAWPKITMNWDTSKESQRYSLDAICEALFNFRYPQGFCLGYVSLAELDKKLCKWSHRDDSELWTVGFPSRLAYLIVYLSEGRSISPPFVRPFSHNELIFGGGHHRYAIVKAIGETEVPIHVLPEDKEQVGALLSVRWEN